MMSRRRAAVPAGLLADLAVSAQTIADIKEILGRNIEDLEAKPLDRTSQSAFGQSYWGGQLGHHTSIAERHVVEAIQDLVVGLDGYRDERRVGLAPHRGHRRWRGRVADRHHRPDRREQVPRGRRLRRPARPRRPTRPAKCRRETTDGRRPPAGRLDRAVDTADAGGVTGASDEWRRCSTLLAEVAKALDRAAEMDVRGSTGTSMKGAFTRSAKSVRKKIERLDQGARALTEAHAAIVSARQDRVALDADTPGMTEPGAFRPDPEKTPEENQTARGLHQGAVNDYWDRYARREAEARRIADALDTKYADSVAVMKQIHGEPDPEPTRTDATGPAPAPRPGQARRPLSAPRARSTPGPLDPPGPAEPAGTRRPAGPARPDRTYPAAWTRPVRPRPLDPSDPARPRAPPGGDSTTGGVAVGGGLGRAGLTNAIRGGLAVPGQADPSRLDPPIGSTSRAAVSGALGAAERWARARPTTGARRGRTAAPAPASRPRSWGARPGRPRPGDAAPAARGASRGAGSGARGAAGAGAAGGRRGDAKDEEEEKSERDLFDDGQDWIDDEEAASGVLD